MTAPWIVLVLSLWLAFVLLTLVVVGVLRRVWVTLERVDALGAAGDGITGLAPGSKLPNFEARDEHGDIVTERLLAGRKAVILFMGPDCSPCTDLAAELARLPDSPLPVHLIVVTNETNEGDGLSFGSAATVVYQKDKEVSSAFRTAIFPYAFALDEDGTLVQRSVTNSVENLKRLAESLEPKGKNDRRVNERR